MADFCADILRFIIFICAMLWLIDYMQNSPEAVKWPWMKQYEQVEQQINELEQRIMVLEENSNDCPNE